jgi:hypothetical protein
MRWIVLALLLTGCATPSSFAIYQHPTTGDQVECEKVGAWRAGFPQLNRYNECKDRIEARGYVRTGTEER